MTDVFISYASEDRERAGRLASALEARGWKVWWDRKIIVGQSFDQAIERELNSAKCVVVLWSQHSIASEWVRNEAAAAVERGVLVPAMIDRIMPPLEFRRKQTADLADWPGQAREGFQSLCEGIMAKTGSTVPYPAATGNDITVLRSTGKTLSGSQVDVMLVKRGFYDKLRNGGGKGLAHQYEHRVAGDAVVVVDHATGLMWLKGGLDAMVLDAAGCAIDRLNAENFAGFSDWRIPTLEEAMSLMEPEAHAAFHIDPVFQRGLNFIWTSDMAPDGRGWVVYFHDGILAAESIEFNAWIKPVR
ncbi:MAG: TIR domain-containing protein [Gammaproteobacteria bacterium]